jgi:predicted nucleic acid-binding Zn finger protein
MKKTRIAVFALLLLGLLVCSIAQSVSAITVGSAVFCPNNFCPGTDTYDEIIIASNYCYDIYWMLVGKYQDNCYEAVNCYKYDYTTILQTLKSTCNKVVVFSKGHRGLPFCGPPYYNTNHMSLIDKNGDDVYDLNDI